MWIVIELGNFRHVMPEDELDRHTLAECKCNPTSDEDDDTFIVHHSFDGRELFEMGERKRS